MSSAEAEAAVLELVRGIDAEVDVLDAELVAARATADFGVEEGLRSVVMRVVDDLEVTVRLTATEDLTLAEPPGLCLVGPFWNPLDAGLSDRCWGDPDLTAVTAQQVAGDPEDEIVLRAGEPLVVEATIARGHERCDYAPGEWTLEVSVRLTVGGGVIGPARLPDVTFVVPIEDPNGPLELLLPLDTRVCSYPAAVVDRQGEPEVIEP